MGYDPEGTYLVKLLDEQKTELCQLRLIKAWTYEQLAAHATRVYGSEATKQTISNFFRSDAGVALLSETHEEIRKKYLEEPLIEQGTRVLAMRDKAIQLERALRDQVVGTEDWLNISSEYRQYLNMISKLIDGTKLNLNTEVHSPATWWQEAREMEKLAG
jgi:hypothetical protein